MDEEKAYLALMAAIYAHAAATDPLHTTRVLEEMIKEMDKTVRNRG